MDTTRWTSGGLEALQHPFQTELLPEIQQIKAALTWVSEGSKLLQGFWTALHALERLGALQHRVLAELLPEVHEGDVPRGPRSAEPEGPRADGRDLRG